MHHGLADVESTVTMQAITLDAMRETCRQSLTVARAAFLYLLYLIALLEVFEAGKSAAGGVTVPLYLPDAF
ncbi:hypothetical protein IU450_25865 [Nocardia abscessus]|uniref:hypothetical protein n=1 Tax=Nocardia abscessus TaxID=120957 RepID=UPI001895E84E|nr:hypothetical protein [Nocardia abscessus]MBF6339294.1 hypothetical protein [Nocardia abscessus]